MIRHLIPRFEWGGWYGAALTFRPKKIDDSYRDEAVGGILCIQWLGLMVEIAIGKVR